MKEQAVEKLRAEMAEKHADAYVQLVGNYLISDLEFNPEHAEFIMVQSKSIAGSLKEMQRVASGKRQGNNYAILTPDEGFSAVMSYYGIREVNYPVDGMKVSAQTATAAARPPAAPKAFDVSLDDLL